MKRVGLYPGTFDPVHQGHMAFALEALRQCKLDTVVLLPERTPRGKTGVSSLADRLTWLQQTTARIPQLRVVELHSPQFTVKETLPELQALFAGAELTLLLGSDVAASLPHWERLEQLLAALSLAIGIRADGDASALHATMRQAQTATEQAVHYVLIPSPHPALSSSQLRSQFKTWPSPPLST